MNTETRNTHDTWPALGLVFGAGLGLVVSLFTGEMAWALVIGSALGLIVGAAARANAQR